MILSCMICMIPVLKSNVYMMMMMIMMVPCHMSITFLKRLDTLSRMHYCITVVLFTYNRD